MFSVTSANIAIRHVLLKTGFVAVLFVAHSIGLAATSLTYSFYS